MNLYIYSDESGVFDNKHEKFFVFGGLIFLDKKEKDDAVKRYKAIEKQIRLKLNTNRELKANILTPNDKKRLLSSINKYFKFGIVIKLDCILKYIIIQKGVSANISTIFLYMICPSKPIRKKVATYRSRGNPELTKHV